MTDVDLERYGTENDLPEGEPGPREPHGQPTEVHGPYNIWQFDAEHSETVEDTYVVARDPSPLDFRMWVFVGRGREAHFVMRSSHRYGVDEPIPDGEVCCEVLFEDGSLTSEHCPEAVVDVVEAVTDAVSVVTPGPRESVPEDSPIRY